MFNKLKNLAVQADATRVYVFEEIDAERAPSLIVRFAGETNAPYINAVLANSRKLLSKGKAALDSASLSKNRRQDRELYPKYVIVGWKEPMLTDEGVPSTDADIPDFINALPDDMFDGLRTYCSKPDNFRPGVSEAVGN